MLGDERSHSLIAQPNIRHCLRDPLSVAMVSWSIRNARRIVARGSAGSPVRDRDTGHAISLATAQRPQMPNMTTTLGIGR
jgi:hypothetical protein